MTNPPQFSDIGHLKVKSVQEQSTLQTYQASMLKSQHHSTNGSVVFGSGNHIFYADQTEQKKVHYILQHQVSPSRATRQEKNYQQQMKFVNDQFPSNSVAGQTRHRKRQDYHYRKKHDWMLNSKTATNMEMLNKRENSYNHLGKLINKNLDVTFKSQVLSQIDGTTSPHKYDCYNLQNLFGPRSNLTSPPKDYSLGEETAPWSKQTTFKQSKVLSNCISLQRETANTARFDVENKPKFIFINQCKTPQEQINPIKSKSQHYRTRP